VVPEAVDTGFGGFHLQQGLAQIQRDALDPAKLVLDQPPSVSGRVGIALDPACTEYPSVRITFVPRLARLGLDVGTFSTISDRNIPDTSSIPQTTYAFSAIPQGIYDVYWADAGKVPLISAACVVVPQVFRGIEINGPSDIPLLQELTDTRSLQVLIPFNDELEGWTVDVVHSVTHEVLSTRRVISAQDIQDVPGATDGRRQFALDLKLSKVLGPRPDYVAVNDAMLLRLVPPAAQVRPTMGFSLFALEAVTPNVAQLAAFSPFGDLVEFQAWVWATEKDQIPVPGRVEFEALELTNAQGSARLELRRSVPIQPSGLISVSLLPGLYRARVHPSTPRYATFETNIRIWERGAVDTSIVQGGRVYTPPNGGEITGQVRLPYPDVGRANLMIQASGLPASDEPATFLPRSFSALTGPDGRFHLTNLDCGECTSDRPVGFTVVAKPPAALGLPWAIKSPTSVRGTSTLDFEVTFPQIHFGLLSFRKRNGNQGAFPGVLIRALALVDKDGRVLPPDAPLCFERTAETQAVPCVSGVLEVAQARSADDGRFRLMIPADLLEFGR
jgi:hypothetical protein